MSTQRQLEASSASSESTEPRGSVWFLGLTLLTLGLNMLISSLVIMDVSRSASEAVHLVGAISFALIVAAGLIPQLIAPARNVAAFQQALVAGLALLDTAAIVGDPDNQGGQYGPFDVTYVIFFAPLLILAAFHPARRDLLKIVQLRAPLVLMAAVIAVPLCIYGVNQGLIQRNSWPPSSDPHHNSHWFVMAELAFTIPLAAGVAGLGGRGWQVVSAITPVTLAALGTISVLFPKAPSSLGIGWGVLAIMTALIFFVVSVAFMGRVASDRPVRSLH